MVRLIDRIGAEKRHHDRFQQEFERDAESETDSQGAGPVLGPHVADVAPWRARPSGPHQHQNGADWHNDITHVDIAGEDNDENRDNSEGPESAQVRSEPIAGWRCGSPVAWKLRNLFRRFRRVPCHHAETPPKSECSRNSRLRPSGHCSRAASSSPHIVRYCVRF